MDESVKHIVCDDEEGESVRDAIFVMMDTSLSWLLFLW